MTMAAGQLLHSQSRRSIMTSLAHSNNLHTVVYVQDPASIQYHSFSVRSRM